MRFVRDAVVMAFFLSAGWAASNAQTTQPAKSTATSERAGASESTTSQPFKLAYPATAPTTQPSPLDELEAWIKKTKNPVPWFKWGADIRVREEYLDNVVTLDKNAPNSDSNWLRYRTRAWMTFTPVKDVDVNLRWLWEGRYIWEPDIIRNVGNVHNGCNPDFVEFDIANLTLRNAFGLPMTIVVGRQEMMLGDGWLVYEGTPLDGSRSIYFDAVRLTYNFEDIRTKADLIYIDQYPRPVHWFPPMSNVPDYKQLTEQEEQGAILYLSNNSLAKTQLDGYFIYKHEEQGFINGPPPEIRHKPTGDNADLYTFGGRQSTDITDHWKLRDELAAQFGNRNGQSVCALATLNRLAYFVNDKWNTRFRLDYEFVSGDDPSTKSTNEDFDMLWGRWWRWSEMYIYTYANESRFGDNSNVHRVALGWTANPIPKIETSFDYNLLFADENTYGGVKPGFSESGCFRGQLLVAWLKWKLNDHLTGHLVGEFFFPGDYYDDGRNDPAAFLRWNVEYSW